MKFNLIQVGILVANGDPERLATLRGHQDFQINFDALKLLQLISSTGVRTVKCERLISGQSVD